MAAAEQENPGVLQQIMAMGVSNFSGERCVWGQIITIESELPPP